MQADQELVRLCLAGDDQALQTLVERYFSAVYNFVFQYLRERKDTEDVTQEVFCKMWQNLAKFKAIYSFKTWLLVMAKNLVFDFLRKKKIPSFTDVSLDEDNDFLETIQDEADCPEEIFEREDLKRVVTDAVNKLPVKERVVVTLYYVEELNFREIAEITDEPLNTVKSRCRRALLRLKQELG